MTGRWAARWAACRALEPTLWTPAQAERVRLAVVLATMPGRRYATLSIAGTTHYALTEARGTVHAWDRDRIRRRIAGAAIDDAVPHGVLRIVCDSGTEDVVLWSHVPA